MRLFLIAISLLALSGCGGTLLVDACEETSGLTVCSVEAVDLLDIDLIVQTTEEKIQLRYPQVVNISERFRTEEVLVVFIDADLSVECVEIKNEIYRCEKHIGGATTDNGHTIYLRWYPCTRTTSLAHELLHALEYFYLNEPQGKDQHSTPFLFNQDAVDQGLNVTEMVEWQIRDEVGFCE